MKKRKSGSRHKLLLYRRTMNRLWQSLLALGLIAIAVGWWSLITPTTILGLHSDIWLFVIALLSIGLAGFAFFSRALAYVQPHENYLSFVMPLIRFRISYQRLKGIRPTLMQQIFPPESSSWARRNFLEPFYGKTALVMEMKGYPLNPWLLKLFMPGEMFYPDGDGLVLLVPDWMKLSTEMDSFFGDWQHAVSRARQGKPA